MEVASIILAATPLIRLIFEAVGLIKKSEKVKAVSHVASGVGIGALSQLV